MAPARVAALSASSGAEDGPIGVPIGANRITILSDLSANLFAALLLILILLLQAKVAAGHLDRSGRPEAPPAPARFGWAAHKPLQPLETIDLLRQRRPSAPGLGIDLTQSGVVLSGAEAGRLAETELDGTQVRTVLDEALGAGASRGPLRLYVFANRWYGSLTRELRAKGLAWTEMSVPRALRAAGPDDRWSAAFRDLIAAPMSLPEFRAGLAQLLAGTRERLVPDGRAIAKSGAPPQAAAAGASSLNVRDLLATIRVVLRLLALSAAVSFVLFVEIVVSDRALGYKKRGWLDLVRPKWSVPRS